MLPWGLSHRRQARPDYAPLTFLCRQRAFEAGPPPPYPLARIRGIPIAIVAALARGISSGWTLKEKRPGCPPAERYRKLSQCRPAFQMGHPL